MLQVGQSPSEKGPGPVYAAVPAPRYDGRGRKKSIDKRVGLAIIIRSWAEDKLKAKQSRPPQARLVLCPEIVAPAGALVF